VIEDVAEGIDTFGVFGTIEGNNINRATAAGIKLVHGARNNKVIGNTIREAGLAGILFGGSNSAGVGDTQQNTVENNEIFFIDPDNVNGSWYGTAAVRFDAPAGQLFSTRFNVLQNNRIWSGNARLAFNVDTPETDNMILNNTILQPGTSDYYGGSAALRNVRDAKPTLVRASHSGMGQSFAWVRSQGAV
jgi:parallel beta-helix repeat protein